MARTFHSPTPDVAIPEQSIFTLLFSKNLEPQLPAFTDAPTGYTLSRADVRIQSLQLAWGLRNILDQKRGSTMAIFSPNSMAWPSVLLGGIAAGLRITTINSAYTPRELVHQLEVLPNHSLIRSVLILVAYRSGQWGVLHICSSKFVENPERGFQTDGCEWSRIKEEGHTGSSRRISRLRVEMYGWSPRQGAIWQWRTVWWCGSP